MTEIHNWLKKRLSKPRLIALGLICFGLWFVFYDPYKQIDYAPEYQGKVGSKEYPRFELVMKHDFSRDIGWFLFGSDWGDSVNWAKDSQTFVNDHSSLYVGKWTVKGEKLSHGEIQQRSPDGSAISGDGKFLYSGVAWQVGLVGKADIETGETVQKFITKEKYGTADKVVLSSDESKLFAWFDDGPIVVFDTETAEVLYTLKSSVGHSINQFAVDQSGKFVAALSSIYKKRIDIWDQSTGELIKSFNFPFHRSLYVAMEFSPDGKILFIGTWNVVPETEMTRRIVNAWDTESWKRVQEISKIDKYTKIFNSIAISPDSRFIAIPDGDDPIEIYDLQERQTFAHLPVEGHINDLAFSPDGNYLAATSTNLFLWKRMIDQ